VEHLTRSGADPPLERLAGPAIATITRTEADLLRMVEDAEFKDATATREAFRDAAVAARSLCATLEEADRKLFAAITTVLRNRMGRGS
jgi:hypothetical protein